MTFATFRALSAMVSESLYDHYRGEKPPTRASTLSYEIEIEHGSHITLASGGDVRDLCGHLSVQPDTIERPPNSRSGIGYLQHWPASKSSETAESYAVALWVPADQMEVLLKAALLGHVPLEIHVQLTGDGIAFDWEPDGSGLTWDNLTHTIVTVSGASFSLAVASKPPPYPDELQQLPTNVGPAHHQLQELSTKLAQGGELLKRVSGRVDVATAAIILLLAFVAWRL